MRACLGADKRLKELEAAADAATKTVQLEAAADVMPPPATDPKIAVMNLVQVDLRPVTSFSTVPPFRQICCVICAFFIERVALTCFASQSCRCQLFM